MRNGNCGAGNLTWQLFCAIKFYSNTPQKMQKYYASKECFYDTKHLKFNTFALFLTSLCSLSYTASGGVQKYFYSLCIFILEFVLTVQKHSEFKHFYTHPEVIVFRSASTTVLPLNIENHLVRTAELHQSFMFHLYYKQ